MDQKKKIAFALGCFLTLLLVSAPSALSQNVDKIKLMDRQYEYGVGRDSITLFFNVYDQDGTRLSDLPMATLERDVSFQEKGRKYPIEPASRLISIMNSGRRIPQDYSFSVLVDQSIPLDGLEKIYGAVEQLVKSAPDSSVFLSFFGNQVTSSELVTESTIQAWKPQFGVNSENKFFYSALYAKLAEFSPAPAPEESLVIEQEGYKRNTRLSTRAWAHPDKTALFVFTEGMNRPSFEDLAFLEVTNYQLTLGAYLPKVYAFYYTENGSDPNIEQTLEGICGAGEASALPEDKRGAFKPASDMETCLADFNEVVNEQSYDYAFTYQAYDNYYNGQVNYVALWRDRPVGEASITVGSPERPWPQRAESKVDFAQKLLIALLAALAVFVLFFILMKVLIPWVKSLAFEAKYYKRYVPDANVQRRVCHYCKQEIQEGQLVVVKCSHIMHVHCWKQNGYKCAEYGQNCKTGIQSHVHWDELFSKTTFRDCFQMIAGICAAFVSWLIFELAGRGGFQSLSTAIADFCMKEGDTRNMLFNDCVGQTSAFLMIGLLLGFFLSLVFRYNDEYRSKDFKLILKILGLSILTGLVGMVAFGLGAMIFCWLVTAIGATFIPWYCSLPAYILFSLAVAMVLTISSSIPMKSALIGGGLAAVIGFLVLLFSSVTSHRWGWMNLLLDFIIYGGGLGASLVTVRMLAEKYFLVIQNGVRAGQRIPIHKWMNATGGGNKVSIGMTGECEIQMNWEKSNKVAKEHARLYIDTEKQLPMIKPMANGVVYNSRADLSAGKAYILSNGDTFKIGDTIFLYTEN